MIQPTSGRLILALSGLLGLAASFKHQLHRRPVFPLDAASSGKWRLLNSIRGCAGVTLAAMVACGLSLAVLKVREALLLEAASAGAWGAGIVYFVASYLLRRWVMDHLPSEMFHREGRSWQTWEYESRKASASATLLVAVSLMVGATGFDPVLGSSMVILGFVAAIASAVLYRRARTFAGTKEERNLQQ